MIYNACINIFYSNLPGELPSGVRLPTNSRTLYSIPNINFLCSDADSESSGGLAVAV